MWQPDPDKLNAYLGRMVGDLGAISSGALVLGGDDLGLYRVMAEGEKMTAAEVARRAGSHDRYVPDWLIALAAAGLRGECGANAAKASAQ